MWHFIFFLVPKEVEWFWVLQAAKTEIYTDGIASE